MNDADKFATYYRDGTTGLDYARNRYYSSILGRFLTADPYINSAGLGDPGSWNRYVYVGGDPVNRIDPNGTCYTDPPPEHEGEGCIGGMFGVFGLMMPFNGPGDKNSSPGGGGHPGLTLALYDVNAISKGKFESKPKCLDFFNALANQLDPSLGISGQELMDEVVAAAKEASLNGYVYDGAKANDKNTDMIDATRFPNTYFSGTIGQFFNSQPNLYGLSQFNGSAIWISSDFFRTAPSSYALGVLMHEFLHKESVGGGFNHDIDMPNALNAVGAPKPIVGQTQNVGSRIGQICF